MLPPGSRILVRLPGSDSEVKATVISCSQAGRSCKLELEDGKTVSVNISKCDFTLEENTGKSPGRVNGGKPDRGHESLSESDDDDASEEDDLVAELDAFLEVGAPADGLNSLTESISADPSVLLHPSEALATFARNAAKEIIDYASKQISAGAPPSTQGGRSTSNGNAPAQAQLYVDGFDPEQIWLQLDMVSVPDIKRARRLLRKVGDISRLVPEDVEEALDDLLAGVNEEPETSSDDGASSEEEEDGDGTEGSLDEDLDDDLDYDALLDNEQHQQGLSDEDEESEEEEEERGGAGKKRKRRMTNTEARAAIEDDFMKLDEMEAFLEAAERQEYGGEGEQEEEEDEEGEDRKYGGGSGSRGMLGSDSDLDDDALGAGSEDEDSDAEEAELEALLDNAHKMVGREKAKSTKGKKKRVSFAGLRDSEDDSEDEEEEGNEDLDADAMDNARYEDFFGPRKIPGSKTPTITKSAAQQKMQHRSRGVLAGSSEEDEEEQDYEEDEEFSDDGGGASEDIEGDDDDGSEGEDKRMSTHQKRMARTADRVRRLEEEAMGERDWFLRGEVQASGRPKNSALEVDMEFDTTVKPPPAPTEESTQSLEELIKKRIAEGMFDDAARIALPPPEKKRTRVELDDKKSGAGLGELYEQDYVAAVTGTVEDRDVPVRELAKAQFAALCAKLDQLSHGHYRPAPSIEEITVKVDVPAILMEEAAPAFVSAASMRAPEEVYRAGQAGRAAKAAANNAANNEDGDDDDGAAAAAVATGPILVQPGGGFKSEAELTREDKKRRRAAKKRAGKKHRAGKDEDRMARATARGQVAVPGRKSEEEQQALRKLAKAAKKSGSTTKYSRSTSVFAQIQAHADGKGAAGPDKDTDGVVHHASRLKL